MPISEYKQVIEFVKMRLTERTRDVTLEGEIIITSKYEPRKTTYHFTAEFPIRGRKWLSVAEIQVGDDEIGYIHLLDNLESQFRAAIT